MVLGKKYIAYKKLSSLPVNWNLIADQQFFTYDLQTNIGSVGTVFCIHLYGSNSQKKYLFETKAISFEKVLSFSKKFASFRCKILAILLR